MRKGAGKLRLRIVCLLAPLFVFSSACDERRDTVTSKRVLSELEQFAFVPVGRSLASSSALSGPDQIAIEEPLLVGMYEVTQAEFRRYLDAAAPVLDPLLLARVASWSSAEDVLPVRFITRAEAVGYADWAGLRLLTGNEWLFCAISSRALAYPWADAWQQGRANTLDLELSPFAATPVGTFEGGRTQTHLYDMLGNVWEWVADDQGGEPGSESSARAFGGSYLTYKKEMLKGDDFFAQQLEPGERREDLGFRVCAPARAWLEQHAGELRASAELRARLEAVGRRWGPSAQQLLRDLTVSSKDAAARGSLDAILSGARG